ncbi:hypothetical protein V5O48_008444 [Marasmius crinis-equi]|uniref:Uncharacterized protein n=1 Tax=Marasmius crinis-equi TaxID=585013 RepID=A0ABR3FE17_9AGAR
MHKQLQEAKGLDPYTSDPARSLGYPTLEVVFADEDRFEFDSGVKEASADMDVDYWTETFASESHSTVTGEVDIDIGDYCEILEKSTGSLGETRTRDFWKHPFQRPNAPIGVLSRPTLYSQSSVRVCQGCDAGSLAVVTSGVEHACADMPLAVFPLGSTGIVKGGTTATVGVWSAR